MNGYAIAGGCILAAACDHRVLARGGRIGASELQVGVPFPVAALEVLTHACGHHVEEVVFGGALFSDDEAIRVGLAHEVVDGDLVLTRALDVAGARAAMRPEAYRMAKQQMRAPALRRIERDQPRFDPATVEVWASTATAGSSAAISSASRPGRPPGAQEHCRFRERCRFRSTGGRR